MFDLELNRKLNTTKRGHRNQSRRKSLLRPPSTLSPPPSSSSLRTMHSHERFSLYNTTNKTTSPASGLNKLYSVFSSSSSSSKSSNRLSMIFLFLLALMVSSCTTTNAFQLDGSQNSFAQFRKWYVGLNGSLELEFKTEQPNGLVLYTDDGGTYDFFELKLVEGALRLRYNLGGGAQIITVGRDLHDGHWHKVQVS